jgi:hypothetical protein
MSYPSTFPSTNSIPPPCFYDMQGLSNWLNLNATYKQYFINYPRHFPNLYAMTSTLSTSRYNIEKVPLSPLITNLSQFQAQRYTQQLSLFRKVYSYNSNAYMNYANNTSSIYGSTVLASTISGTTQPSTLSTLRGQQAQIPRLSVVNPTYFRFQSYKEHTEYKSSVAMVNKMYPFDAMALGNNQNGSTLGWVIPFPL